MCFAADIIACVATFMLFAASRSGGRQRSPLYHNFSTNAAPKNGSCDVTPTLGYAVPIVTLFNVSCYGYSDPDEPLDYGLYFNFSGMYYCRQELIVVIRQIKLNTFWTNGRYCYVESLSTFLNFSTTCTNCARRLTIICVTVSPSALYTTTV